MAKRKKRSRLVLGKHGRIMAKRAAYSSKRSLPAGVVRDPDTGRFMSSWELIASREYRAEQKRIGRVKKAKGAAAKREVQRRKKRVARWVLRPDERWMT